MQFRRPTNDEVTINMAPLVDVVFLLVIFFAVSTTFLETAGLELALPASTSTAERKPDEVAVWLTAEGRVYLNETEIPRETLVQAVRDRLAGSEHRFVVLRADAETPHGDVVAIMDLVRQAGAEGLTVAARSAPK